MKTNYNFGKLENHVPTYAHSPLRVVTHHHEEWDEEVYDEETGEPTGETIHRVSDWDTWETKLRPTSEDYLAMGWLPMVDKPPDPQEGCYVRKTGLADEVDGRIVMRYEQVPLPPQVHTYKKSYLAQWIRANGKWETFLGLLSQSDDLNFFWNTSTEFDSNHEKWGEILVGVKMALGLTDEEISEMLAYGERGA